MTMARNFAASLVMALALSACQGEEQAPQAGAAGGEILPASISDDMLPLDTVRSQPPLAPRPAASGKAEATGAAKEEEKPAAEETPVPAAPVKPNAE
jgi:hypothetical protein